MICERKSQMFKWKYDPQNVISLFGISAIAWMLYAATPEKQKSYEHLTEYTTSISGATIACSSNAVQNGTTTSFYASTTSSGSFYASTTSGGSVLWGQGYSCSIITK
jgi:hypothetical protein